MNTLLRLVLFVCLVFAGQGYATTAVAYGYEVNAFQAGVENLSNNGLINPSGCCSNSSSRDSQDRAQARAFFVSLVDFVVPKGPLWSSTKSKSAVENAFGHWSKHKGEFPELQNAKQYAEKAKDFLTNPPKGSLTKVNSRGDTLRYDPGTNTFGVLSKDGAPRTMFRPKDGMDYWNRQ